MNIIIITLILIISSIIIVCLLNILKCLFMILKLIKKSNEILSEFMVDTIDLLIKDNKYKGE